MTKISLGLKVVIPISILCGGGTELQTLQLAKTLIKADCDVEVICYNEYYPEVAELFKKCGVKVVFFNHNNRGKKISLFHKIYRYLLNNKPEVVHVQYVELGFLTLFAAWLAKVPVRFASVHQLGDSYGIRSKALMKASLILSSAFHFVSLAAERSWFGNGTIWNPDSDTSEKHYTIYNCIDTDIIDNLVLPQKIKSFCLKHELQKHFVIGIIGRICEAKGHFILLEALSAVRKKRKYLKVIVVGDPLEAKSFIIKAKKMGLYDCLIITGWLPPTELYSYYKLMDVVAIPSFSESFGLVAIESIFSGCLVVATKVGGLSEIVEDGITGYLVEPGNPQQLSKGLLRIEEGKGLLKGTALINHLKSKLLFDQTSFSKSMLSFYRKKSGTLFISN